MSPILLDTHVAIWATNGKLHASSAALIDAAAQRGELLLSPISAWEIGMLVAKGRLQLASGVQDYVRMLFAQKGLIIAALTPAIAGSAAALQGPMHGDPADRILIASAVATGARLMTHDQRIHEFAKSTKHLRCIDCSTN